MYFRFRNDGNCFINCLIRGCGFFGDRINAVKVFSKEILSGPPWKEFEPAIKYLISNAYRIIIYDPEPINWGIIKKDKRIELKRIKYIKKDIYKLANKGFCIIPCSLDPKSLPLHAVLIYKSGLWDPINEIEWKQRHDIKIFPVKYFPKKTAGRFLLAFKKKL